MLELAAWKATCIMDLEENMSFYDTMEWLKNGWKKNKTKKKDLRHSSAMSVIVRNAVGFLEAPHWLSTVKTCREAIM